jgi:citrate lyase subunit beta / citryl-CoA lyase
MTALVATTANAPAMMRSLLFLPGNREKFLEKAVALDADGFIIDFEDSVPDAEKAAARKCLATYAPALRGKAIWVRPNAPGTQHFEDDLAAICGTPGVNGLLLPKAETVAGLREADAAVATQENAAGLSRGTLKVILTIESALGVIRAFDLLTATGRTETLCFGGARDGDLMTDLGCGWSNRSGTLEHARAHTLLAARAASCPCPLDGVFADVKDPAGFEHDTRQSRALGYRGRTLIHPSQIEPANRLYSPAPREIAESLRLVEAFEEAVARGHASVLFEGRMIDIAMAKAARNVIAWAEAHRVT